MDSAHMPRILGIIPARGGSKSIPRKNIIPICGKPLIYYSIASAQQSKLLDAFIVSTDDPEIAEVAKSFGADVPFLRPAEFAQDGSTDIEFMRHALLTLKEERRWQPEILVNLRPTSPFRSAQDIDAVLTIMLETNCDSVRSLSKPQNNPFKMWRIAPDNRMEPLLPTEHFDRLGVDVPRQLLPQNVYWTNGLIDATRTKFILDHDKIYGPDIRCHITDPKKSLDLDEPEDLEEITGAMQRHLGL